MDSNICRLKEQGFSQGDCLVKATQGFVVSAWRGRKVNVCALQPETRGERRSEQKGLFLEGN